MTVKYKVFPIDKPEPGFPWEKETWVPVLNVGIIVGHSRSRLFEAVVDSGSASCLFHADIGKAHGLKLESGAKGPLGGVISGATASVYYHPVKLVIASHIIQITAGFTPALSVAAILGRHGFFEHFKVVFDPASSPPGLTIERIHRA